MTDFAKVAYVRYDIRTSPGKCAYCRSADWQPLLDPAFGIRGNDPLIKQYISAHPSRTEAAHISWRLFFCVTLLFALRFQYMQKDFDAWNEIKKKLEASKGNSEPFPQRGEVWMCSLGKNIGFEQNGSGDNFSRPVLVVKKFNNRMFWCVPLSTKQKKFDFYYNFTDPNKQKVSAILAQLRLISVKRLKRNVYGISHVHLHEIKTRLRTFLE